MALCAVSILDKKSRLIQFLEFIFLILLPEEKARSLNHISAPSDGADHADAEFMVDLCSQVIDVNVYDIGGVSRIRKNLLQSAFAGNAFAPVFKKKL